MTRLEIARMTMDFGLGASIAYYLWWLPDPIYHSWGWTTPFLMIFVLLGVGLPWGGGALFVLLLVTGSREIITHGSHRQRMGMVTAAATAVLAAIIAVAGPGLGRVAAIALPPAFVMACGLPVSLFVWGKVRTTRQYWLWPLPDAIGVAASAASVLLIFKHNLLATEPAAAFLFPLAVWVGLKVWLAMRNSAHLTLRAGADITLSLWLGAGLVLFLVWLANLLGMPRSEVAALRDALSRAGAVADLPWWLWTGLYVLLASLSLAFVIRPVRTDTVRHWFGRLRVGPAAGLTRRMLSGVHIGLLAIVLVGLTTPPALASTFQRKLAAAYTVALQRRLAAAGELAAYAQVRQHFTGRSAPRRLVQIIIQIHQVGHPPAGDDNATSSEDDLAQRVGALQAATLNLQNAHDLLAMEQAGARRAGLGTPLRGEADLKHRLDGVATQDQDESDTQSNATQAGELAATALASTISIPHIGSHVIVQIIGEYLSGLVEESSLKDTFAALAERLPGASPAPDAQTMVTPDPGKLKIAAYKELATEFANAGDTSELDEDQAVSNAMTKTPLTAAVALAGQTLHPNPGSCAGCTAPGQPEDEPEPPPDDGG